MKIDLRYPDPNERPTSEPLDVEPLDVVSAGMRFVTDEETTTILCFGEPPRPACFHLSALTVHVLTRDKIPNRIHRIMQRLILGIRWEIHDD